MMIGYPVEPSPEIVEEVTCMLRKGGIQAVRDAEQYVLKSGAGPMKKTDIQGEFVKLLSGFITNGLVRLTVERVTSTDEFRQSARETGSPTTIILEKLPPLNLPEYSPYVTIAIRTGATEVWQMKTAFSVKSLVSLKNTRISVQDKKLKEFKFGSLNAAMALYLKKDRLEEELHSFERGITVPSLMAPRGQE